MRWIVVFLLFLAACAPAEPGAGGDPTAAGGDGGDATAVGGHGHSAVSIGVDGNDGQDGVSVDIRIGGQDEGG